MNFFDDDFGLGDSPMKGPSSKPPMPKKPATSKSIKGGDDFDDLLDELLDKQAKKNSKKKIQNTSHAFTQKQFTPSKQPQKSSDNWEPSLDFLSNKNQQNDLAKTYQPPPPMRNRPSTRSIYDGGSEDNKSIRSGKSGLTAQGNYTGFLDNIGTVKPSETNIDPPTSSMRNMMRQPLRKRGQSRQPSILNQSTNKIPQPSLKSYQQLESVKIIAPTEQKKGGFNSFGQRQNALTPGGLQLSQSMPEKQKIVYVKEDNAKVKEQFQKQLKMVKQSHQRQIKFLKDELQKESNTLKEIKIKMMQQFEEQRSKDKQLWQKLSKKDLQKTKQMYEWEIKKKTESYQMQIEKLKKLSDLAFANNTQSSGTSGNIQLERQQLRIKEKELDYKNRKIEDMEKHIRDKERALENRQFDFDNYRRREQEKLQGERKSLYNLQAELERRKAEIRKQTEGEKLNLVNDLARQQLQISRQKQRIKLQKQELDMERQLFEKQKIDYEAFNANIVKDYKLKLRELDLQKQQYQSKQIQLYKKIHTVQLVANAKGIKVGDPAQPPPHNNSSKNKINAQNDGNANNKQRVSSVPHEQHHVQQQQSYLDEHIRKSTHSYIAESNTNLKSYLLKMNKDNKRMRPSFI